MNPRASHDRGAEFGDELAGRPDLWVPIIGRSLAAMPPPEGASREVWTLSLFLTLAADVLHDSRRIAAKALAPTLTRIRCCDTAAARTRAAVETIGLIARGRDDRPPLPRCLNHVTAAAQTCAPNARRQCGPIRRRLISP